MKTEARFILNTATLELDGPEELFGVLRLVLEQRLAPYQEPKKKRGRKPKSEQATEETSKTETSKTETPKTETPKKLTKPKQKKEEPFK